MDHMEIVQAAEAHDGVAPLSEQFLRGLTDSNLGHKHYEVEGGFAAVAPDGAVELVVHPEHRRKGRGRELFSLVDAPGNPIHHTFWAHGNLEPAQRTAEALGMHPARELLVMSASVDELASAGVLDAQLPDGFEALDLTQATERYGEDAVLANWLSVNNDAFSWHPEQGGWDLGRLRQGMDTEWFDPHGVWLLYKGADLAGFHWTKRHPGETGEVYVVGLASEHRGEGLGVPLLSIGLKHLVETGSSQVILYVEADNVPAVKRYRETGFTVAESHVVYEFPLI